MSWEMVNDHDKDVEQLRRTDGLDNRVSLFRGVGVERDKLCH